MRQHFTTIAHYEHKVNVGTTSSQRMANLWTIDPTISSI